MEMCEYLGCPNRASYLITIEGLLAKMYFCLRHGIEAHEKIGALAATKKKRALLTQIRGAKPNGR